jgi:hypothetical protein
MSTHQSEATTSRNTAGAGFTLRHAVHLLDLLFNNNRSKQSPYNVIIHAAEKLGVPSEVGKTNTVMDIATRCMELVVDSPQTKKRTICARQDALGSFQHSIALQQLLHAVNCERDTQCIAQNCDLLKKLWIHMTQCTEQKCANSHCKSYKHLLKHYHHCNDLQCPVCSPVRSDIRRNKEKKDKDTQIHCALCAGVATGTSEHKPVCDDYHKKSKASKRKRGPNLLAVKSERCSICNLALTTGQVLDKKPVCKTCFSFRMKEREKKKQRLSTEKKLSTTKKKKRAVLGGIKTDTCWV